MNFITLGSSAGFDIVLNTDTNTVLFAQRNTRSSAIVAWIFGGLTLIFGTNALIWLAYAKYLLGGSFATVAVIVFLIARIAFKSYQRKIAAPLEEVVAFSALLNTNELQQHGERRASLNDVAIDTPLNLGDSTQGMMRKIRLRWPGGSIIVFNANSQQAIALAQHLARLRVGHLRR